MCGTHDQKPSRFPGQNQKPSNTGTVKLDEFGMYKSSPGIFSLTFPRCFSDQRKTSLTKHAPTTGIPVHPPQNKVRLGGQEHSSFLSVHHDSMCRLCVKVGIDSGAPFRCTSNGSTSVPATSSLPDAKTRLSYGIQRYPKPRGLPWFVGIFQHHPPTSLEITRFFLHLRIV